MRKMISLVQLMDSANYVVEKKCIACACSAPAMHGACSLLFIDTLLFQGKKELVNKTNEQSWREQKNKGCIHNSRDER